VSAYDVMIHCCRLGGMSSASPIEGMAMTMAWTERVCVRAQHPSILPTNQPPGGRVDIHSRTQQP